MAKLPFTADGIQQKADQLYQLQDPDLLVQVKAMSSDISSWLDQNFILTDSMKAYIASAPDLTRFGWGAMAAAIASARRPVYPENPPKDYPPPKRTKQIIFTWEGFLSYYQLASGLPEIGGDLQLSISYKLME